MPVKLKKNLVILSYLFIALLAIFLLRILKIYDIFCYVLKIVSPIIFGFIFSWILYPVFKRLERKFGKFWSCGILISIFLLVYALMIWKLIPVVLKNTSNLLKVIESYIEKFSKYPLLGEIKNYRTLDMDVLVSSCSGIISVVSTIVLVHIFGFYMLYNYELVTSFLKSCIPKKYKKIVLEYINKLSTNMRMYIRGTLLDTLMLFIISSILYIIIGIKYPIMLASISAFTNIIPFIGPYIGGAVAVLIALGQSVKLAIVTVVVIIFAQTVESNIINPMIMSKCIKINPLLIVIALTIMGSIFGLLGMIFAVPVLIILKLTIEFLKKYKKIKS